jgi:hypothetical protein
MVPVHQHKYVEELLTPVLLFDCTLADGQVERWSTHSATWQNIVYSPRVVSNSGFRIGLLADDGADWGNRMTVTLANTDGYVTNLHRTENLKGCALLVSFAFLDPESGQIVSTPEAVFTGSAMRRKSLRRARHESTSPADSACRDWPSHRRASRRPARGPSHEMQQSERRR